MEAHIVTIPNEDVSAVSPGFKGWHELHAAKFTFDEAFRLALDDGQHLTAHKVLRVMPKKRMVVFATWAGRPVVAKLFFDAQHARRHMEKEQNGAQILAMNKIPSPALYYSGVSEDRRVYVLIYRRIYDAQSLEDAWREGGRESNVLELALKELATQHVQGVNQRDLHFRNFLLLEENTIYTLDGGQVDSYPRILPRSPSINSVGLFLSQLGVGHEEYQDQLFRFYASLRGWIMKPEDFTELRLAIKEWNTVRWQNFEKKIFRNSTDFCLISDKQMGGVYDRRYAGIEFLSFLKDPDAVFHQPGVQVLKNGNSSTVIKVTLDHRELVVKRYNMKNVWHRLRRCLRTTRAAKSWRLAQKLNLFGVPTARPVAFLERKTAGLRSQSYYISEYVSGEHAGEYFNSHRREHDRRNAMAEKIALMLKNLQKLDLSHGDLKQTNILVDDTGQPVFIDLDGAREHMSLVSLRSAWQKEIKRFLLNFQEQPDLREKFTGLLSTVG